MIDAFENEFDCCVECAGCHESAERQGASSSEGAQPAGEMPFAIASTADRVSSPNNVMVFGLGWWRSSETVHVGPLCHTYKRRLAD